MAAVLTLYLSTTSLAGNGHYPMADEFLIHFPDL